MILRIFKNNIGSVMVGNICKWCVIGYKNLDGRKCEFIDIIYIGVY